jgi:tRNA dimethylallyltransferase
LNSAIAILGPTGAGKSALAVALAERWQGEIVNCDSMQVYRGLDVGTAKTIPAGVPAHLFDICDPTEVMSAGEYARRARSVLEDIVSRGRLPVIAGGTGFYLRALVDGLFTGPERNEDLRRRLGRRTGPRLHRILRRVDPSAAGKIHPNDKSKLIRALEVCLQSGRPMSELWAGGRQALEGFRVVKIGLDPPRPALYERINERARRMFESRLLEEVRALLACGTPETAKPFEAPGYREALAVLRGEMTQAQAIELTQRRTRQYAKRQMTWLRRERDVHWLRGFGEDPTLQRAVLETGLPNAYPARSR